MSLLVKLGGRALQDALERPEYFSIFKNIKDDLILVHGGGAEISRWAERFGVESTFVRGQRVTSPELLDVVQSVLCGHLNPKLVWQLELAGIPALGMNGYAGRLLECETENTDLGLVGRPVKVNHGLIRWVLNAGRVPVIAPLGVLKDGQRCNVNADLAACSLATALTCDRLILLTDTAGILDGNARLIPDLTITELEELENSGVVKGGMTVKSRAIKEYLAAQPSGEVFVARGLGRVDLESILSGKKAGTRIRGN